MPRHCIKVAGFRRVLERSMPLRIEDARRAPWPRAWGGLPEGGPR